MEDKQLEAEEVEVQIDENLAQPDAQDDETSEKTTQKEEETQALKPDYEALFKESEEKFLRVHAEFENIKKRLEKEKYTAIDFANEQFARDLLSVVDTLEMALQTDESTDLAKIKEGVQMTSDNLLKALKKQGVGVVSHDDGFDPNFHEAVMQANDKDKKDGEIVQVLQKGYLYNERVLRPSMVSVNKTA